MPQRRTEPSPSSHYLAVFVGGFVGALARAGLLELWPVTVGHWPWATFTANIAGCAALAWLITHQGVNGWSSARLALLGTGFCGALTTFSTIQIEIYELVDLGDIELAAAYALASVGLGLLAVSVARRYVSRGGELA